MVGRAYGSKKEADLARDGYQKASKSDGVVFGRGNAPFMKAKKGEYFYRIPEELDSVAINMAVIDGAMDAGKPVRLVSDFTLIWGKTQSRYWLEIERVVCRGGTLIFK
jgi:hypothetical protein